MWCFSSVNSSPAAPHGTPRADRPVAPIDEHDAARALHRRTVSRPRSGNRPSHRVPAMRLDLIGDHRRPHGRIAAQCIDGQGFDLAVHVLTPREIHELYPLANVADVVGGIHIPSDGYANAVDITQALAKGARNRGVRIFQDVKVSEILHDGSRVSGVQTPAGRLGAEFIVLCGGMWTRDLAARIGVTVPLHACEHYYVLFQDVPASHPTFRYCATTIIAVISSTTRDDCSSAHSSLMRALGRRRHRGGLFVRRDSRGFQSLRTGVDGCHAPLAGIGKGRHSEIFCGPESFTRTCATISVNRPS